jgi:transposase InsO family protein
MKTLRITAWCLRFVDKIRASSKSSSTKKKGKRRQDVSPLTAAELQKAEKLWIRSVQRHYFAQEVRACLKEKGAGLMLDGQLPIQLDEDGIIRVSGRLANATIPDEAIRPILLPRYSPFTRLIIRHTHELLRHAGTSHTLAQLRLRYWIPKGRTEVHQTIRRCSVCLRFDGGPYKLPNSPDLPETRVGQSTPFSNVGIDYFGPVFTKEKRSLAKKRWVVIYACMVTRAIHLDVVEEMSSDMFVLSLRRFVSIYGPPKLVVSDNGSSFKSLTVRRVAASLGIEWRFIPEGAPWMGGFYERLIRMVKTAFRKSMKSVTTPLQNFLTDLTEIQSHAHANT